MTLYLLFEQLEAGTLRLDTPLGVSGHASEQSPTKLGLRPGQTIMVEDAILGLVTKSANDAAVVIAEALGGSEHDFAELMTRKAHALGMTRTIYRNASGLPNDEQVTTAHDQAVLGRAIQERFPRESRYFATPSFTYHGMSMRNHNHLLGQVAGMDGIKTGYTEASGYNLVTSVRRNGRHLISVVLGGPTASARDARMRSLIEEYIVAAGAPQNGTAVAEAQFYRTPRTADSRPSDVAETDDPSPEGIGLDSARTGGKAAARSRGSESRSRPLAGDPRQVSQPAAPTTYVVASSNERLLPPPVVAAPATVLAPVSHLDSLSGAAAPVSAAKPSGGLAEPIKPIHVKTIKVKLPAAQGAAPGAAEAPTTEWPPDPAYGREVPPAMTPAAALPRRVATAVPVQDPGQAPAMAEPPRDARSYYTTRESGDGAAIDPARAAAQRAARQTSSAGAAPSTAGHSGWIIQVGAFDLESEAQQKLSAVRAKASQLGHADPFTEAVQKGDKTFYRARFAGLQKNEAEAICKQLKRNDIDCMTVKN